jgi:hypothetical protein
MKEAKKAAFRYTRADAPDLQFVPGGEEDVQPRIKAASLERLVERLTYDKYPCTHHRTRIRPHTPRVRSHTLHRTRGAHTSPPQRLQIRRSRARSC